MPIERGRSMTGMLYCVDPACPFLTELEPENKNYSAAPEVNRSSVSVATITNKCFEHDDGYIGAYYEDPRSDTELQKVPGFVSLVSPYI